MEDCAYLLGKCRSLEPGAGWLNSFINALFLLKNVTSKTSSTAEIPWRRKVG